ncbi:MAG TPA: hypothetical protein VH000_09775 [Rhizomicrobium sp.]|jgi:hypothetical protein|nr:hypothetical protein [Rhizomicrobium sp.]HEX4534506.1 hypothetical protein [Rhizomicrobium sp.]
MFNKVIITLIAVFFAIATAILLVTGVALLWPGTFLDQIWHLNESRRALLMPYRIFLAPRFIIMALPMALASVGCFLRRRWGWWLTLAIFLVNGLGNAAQLFVGHIMEGMIGVGVAALLIAFLLRPRVRAIFS